MEYCEHNRAKWNSIYSTKAIAEHDAAPATQAIREFVPNPAYETAAYEMTVRATEPIHVGPPPATLSV